MRRGDSRTLIDDSVVPNHRNPVTDTGVLLVRTATLHIWTKMENHAKSTQNRTLGSDSDVAIRDIAPHKGF